MEIIFSTALLAEISTWRTVTDILLIAAGLFFLYRTMVGLGTWKIVTGIFVAIAVFFLANILDLKGVEWILYNISQVAIIALIIIFQPELRRLLERAASIKRSGKGQYKEGFSKLLAESVFLLAQKSQGAIIVLVGKDPIDKWLSGGFALDAKVSIPLVLSIFDPNSPGHDGALIVTGGRFTRFGVRLPLSQGHTLSSDYGTRHHAAMGLSEKTDALVIVASEERGKVSIFIDGNMQPMTDEDQLAGIILTHGTENAIEFFGRPVIQSRRLVFSQMMASLLVSVLFYATLIVAQGEILEKVITAPLEYTAPPAELVLTGDKDKEVSLHLSGQRSDLNHVAIDQVKVKIDLSKAVAGKQTFLITKDNMKLPRGVDLLDVVPQSIELELARIVQHEMTVKPQLVGKLPRGLRIRSIEMVPEKVMVLSPALPKEGTETSVTTTPIYLESISEDSKIFCKIIAPPSVHPVDKRWPDVQVTLYIEKK